MPTTSDDTLHYARTRGQIVRWSGEERPTNRPEPLEIMMPRAGWVRARKLLAQHVWRNPEWLTPPKADQWLARACCRWHAGDPRRNKVPRCSSRLRWLISPPLAGGTPRVLGRAESRVAQGEYEDWLGSSEVPERAVGEATRGWERTRDRENGIEAKSQSFLQIVGVTTTLLLANGTLLHGQDAIKGAAATALIVCLAVASAALIAAGIYGLFGSMRTFGRVPANSGWRVIERAHHDEADSRKEYIAVILLSEDRTARIANWKLARLKRAMWSLLTAVPLIVGASIALIVASQS